MLKNVFGNLECSPHSADLFAEGVRPYIKRYVKFVNRMIPRRVEDGTEDLEVSQM